MHYIPVIIDEHSKIFALKTLWAQHVLWLEDFKCMF